MNFTREELLPYLAVGVIVLSIAIIVHQRKFFKIIKRYFFYDRSTFHYLSTLLYLGSIALFATALLDLRGEDQKVKIELPEARTMILIDTSASMLAEDVQPSRLQRAAFIAKHFVRKSAGQQIAVAVFAEIQKKIVPFTTDLDLLDARLDTIKNLRNQYGSSAISVVIQDSLQYFYEGSENTVGNILVLTDGEETSEGLNLKLPEGIKLAMVGVGTERGGRIPLDDGRGFRFGYKKTRGEDVITKLHEDFFKRVVADTPGSKYWIANSYSLPTDEITEFFTGEFNKEKSEREMVIKPVEMERLIFPAILFFVLSVILKMFKTYSLPRK